jgi:hypothetical protein
MQRAGVAIGESDITGPVGGDVQRTNQMSATNTWEDAGGHQLRVSVTVVQEADSFLYRRPPPLRVGEFTVEGPTPKAAGKGSGVMKSKAQLALVGRLPRKAGGSVGHITLHGKHAYLVNENVFQVVDVANPAMPRIAGSYQPKAHLGPVAVSGDHAYVVEKGALLRVLDVSNPAQPRVVGSSKLPDPIQGLAVADKRVYVSMNDSLRILDVSNPALPKRSERAAPWNSPAASPSPASTLTWPPTLTE